MSCLFMHFKVKRTRHTVRPIAKQTYQSMFQEKFITAQCTFHCECEISERPFIPQNFYSSSQSFTQNFGHWTHNHYCTNSFSLLHKCTFQFITTQFEHTCNCTLKQSLRHTIYYFFLCLKFNRI